MPFEERFADFTDPSDFGSVAAYRSFGAAKDVSINVIFDAAYIAEAGGFVDSAGPVLGCAEADVPDIDQRATFTVNDVEYRAKDVQPDGLGWLRVELEKQ